MGNGRRNQRHSDNYEAAARAADENILRASKQALAAQRARRRQRAGAKTLLGEAPPAQHRAEAASAFAHPRAPFALPVARKPVHATLDFAASLVEHGSRKLGLPLVGRAAQRCARWVGRLIDAMEVARAEVARIRGYARASV